MANLIPSGDFSTAIHVKSGDDIVEYVGGNPRHVRVVSSVGHPTNYRFETGHITYGSMYSFKVLAKTKTGVPRIWFEAHSQHGLLNDPIFEFREIDSNDDWKLYEINYKANDPRIERLKIYLGFWSAGAGECFFKDPYLTITEEDYDGRFMQPRTLAEGTVGWNGTAIVINPSFRTHGILSVSWDSTNKHLDITYKNSRLSTDSSGFPNPSITLYNDGLGTLGGHETGIVPVITLSNNNRLRVQFIDCGDGTRIDITTLSKLYICFKTIV